MDRFKWSVEDTGFGAKKIRLSQPVTGAQPNRAAIKPSSKGVFFGEIQPSGNKNLRMRTMTGEKGCLFVTIQLIELKFLKKVLDRVFSEIFRFLPQLTPSYFPRLRELLRAHGAN